MERTFSAFKNLIERQSLTLEQLGFLPGASVAELDEFEAVIGRPLPAGLRYFLSQTNGQTENGMLCLPGCACARLLSCAEMIQTWRFEYKEAAKEGAMEFAHRYQDEDRVRSVLHSPDRIILAHEVGIVVFALDYLPGPAGKEGQVITDVSECEYMVLAPSFESYFDKVVRLMHHQTLTITESDDYECWILGHQGDLMDPEDFVRAT